MHSTGEGREWWGLIDGEVVVDVVAAAVHKIKAFTGIIAVIVVPRQAVCDCLNGL